MEILALLIVAALAISQTEILDSDEMLITSAPGQQVAFVDVDEGDIGQIFGTSQKVKPIVVVVEEPIVQVQVDCYKTTELVRDLTIPYSQRSYIQPDGTSCTPVE